MSSFKSGWEYASVSRTIGYQFSIFSLNKKHMLYYYLLYNVSNLIPIAFPAQSDRASIYNYIRCNVPSISSLARRPYAYLWNAEWCYWFFSLMLICFMLLVFTYALFLRIRRIYDLMKCTRAPCNDRSRSSRSAHIKHNNLNNNVILCCVVWVNPMPGVN